MMRRNEREKTKPNEKKKLMCVAGVFLLARSHRN